MVFLSRFPTPSVFDKHLSLVDILHLRGNTALAQVCGCQVLCTFHYLFENFGNPWSLITRER